MHPTQIELPHTEASFGIGAAKMAGSADAIM
jgi:hypothetical protein